MTKEEDEGKLLLRLYKLYDFDESNLSELPPPKGRRHPAASDSY
jgi:hypothetical protein